MRVKLTLTYADFQRNRDTLLEGLKFKIVDQQEKSGRGMLTAEGDIVLVREI